MIGRSELVGERHTLTVALSATSASQTVFVAPTTDEKYRVLSASARFGTASTSGTVQVEVAGAGVAVGSGTNQLATTLSLSGTANTTVNEAASNQTIFDYTSALNLIIAGTMTSLANCVVTLVLERVN